MAARALWLRWSWRDLRRRWPVVVAIALIIGVGTGVYAGFSSMAAWRRASNDLNYSRLGMYDLRVRLTPGTFAPAGALRDVVGNVNGAGLVDRVEERLIVPVQVDASTDDRDLLVHGELVGIDLSDGEPAVNQLRVTDGRALEPADTGREVAVLHAGFAGANGLPATGTLRAGGDRRFEYVGLGVTPDYFVITARSAGYVPVGNLPHYAVVFTSLESAQRATGQPGMVNDLVLTLAAGADRGAMQRNLELALAEYLPDVSVTVLTTEEDEGYRILYQDIDSDQRLVTILAIIILGGAALAAFNLSSRLVEAQRREIGIGMALGVPPTRLAIRPLLFGAQVATLGVLISIPIGLLVGEAMKPILRAMVPLPEWQTPIQVVRFAQAGAIGFLLPFLATIYPVVRAVWVEPVNAIRAGFLAPGSGGLAPLLRRISIPGRSVAHMPLRNLLRTPRRTLLTALAIGGAVTALVATLGLIDTFNRAIDRTTAETLRSAPDRIDAQLDSFYPRDAEQLAAIAAAPGIAEADFGLRLEGIVSTAANELPLVIDLLDFADSMWTPTIAAGAAPGPGEILLAEKAAGDLGVQPGDRVLLRHPRREGLSYRMVETPIVVAGLHPGPLRFNAYVDRATAGLFGFEGLVNYAQLRPTPDASVESIRRTVFALPGVSVAQSVSETGSQLQDVMSQFYDVLMIAELATLAITFLIGFNATSIATDERARDHATMFAFGLPVGVVLRINLVESITVGLLGLVIGIATGFLVLNQVVGFAVSETLPEIALRPTLTPATLITALVMAVVAVAAAPLFTIRRLRRMDISGTLRVVE